MTLDDTHDPARLSWVASANGHPEFPIQNLPLGVFVPPRGGAARPGVAIGDYILELHAAAAHLDPPAREAAALAGDTLNAFFAAGPAPRRALRQGLADLLDVRATPRLELLHDARASTIKLPCAIGDYTDFYAGIHHATNVGRLFRPDQPLMPNYKYVPIGYHGRASSVVVSGTPVRRPSGQRKPASETVPSFGACRNLDYELELGIWIGPGNALGAPIGIADAAAHIAGYCLLNDWSARDIQGWEYQPLGPFLAKSFATTISPWVVTPEALAPFRIAEPRRPEGDPAPLPYLSDAHDQAEGALDITLEVLIETASMRTPHPLAQSSTRHLYWTPAQMVAHHGSNGCNLRSGDLFGSGTISGPGREELGSLLELTEGGRAPVVLPSGETRRFLEDGDRILFRAIAQRDGFAPVGFGCCEGVIQPE